jgi:tetratricopeptide (TPR) repeat protein
MSAEGADAAHVALLKQEAEAHLAAGRVEEARKRFSEALRLAPRDVDARDGMARCAATQGDAALAAGDSRRATSYFQMALELAPFHPQADAGLRRAAELEQRKSGDDAIGRALDVLPPVRALRDLQTADRVMGRMTGTAPTQLLRDSLETRRAGLAASGAPPRQHRIEHEMAAAWKKRWVFRLLGPAVVALSLLLYGLTASAYALNWGLVLGIFAVVWDIAFVERGHAAARRVEGESPGP